MPKIFLQDDHDRYVEQVLNPALAENMDVVVGELVCTLMNEKGSAPLPYIVTNPKYERQLQKLFNEFTYAVTEGIGVGVINPDWLCKTLVIPPLEDWLNQEDVRTRQRIEEDRFDSERDLKTE